jgi:hypothetical protein
MKGEHERMPTKRKTSKRKAPWDKPAPKKSSRTKLSAAQKRSAKKSAKKAGRPYPNLVDNMRAARSAKRKKK